MVDFLFCWIIVSLIGVMMLAFTNSFVNDTVLKVKHIICGVLFLPMTILIAIIIGLMFIIARIESLKIVNKIEKILNKEIKI